MRRTHTHPFGDLLRQIRSRVPGLTQARLAELAGYDPAVITRMAQGQQDLIGPQARERVLHVIQALDAAGALHGLADANALLTAANLSILSEVRAFEAGLIYRFVSHAALRSRHRLNTVAVEAPPEVFKRLHALARHLDRVNAVAERIVVLAEAGELAMQYGQETLGMRLLACASRDAPMVTTLGAAEVREFQRRITTARATIERADMANAWVVGQLLTLEEARSWLVALPGLMGE